MSLTTFDDQLNLLESQLVELTNGLIDGNPSLLLDSSNKIQQLSVDLLQMTKDPQRNKLALHNGLRRLKALASGMATFRENLLRRTAYIDCALGVLIPATLEKSTYTGSGVYGSAVKRSGAFAAFSA